MTKYIVLIGDGMSDHPIKELGGKTPLEVAKTPNLDFLARNGICGWTKNVPTGMDPGSDVAVMSIFGYNPKKYYTGRGPLEAASIGVKLKEKDVAFRCNLVSIKNGKMESFTAHHIETEEAKKIMKVLNDKLGNKKIKFYSGLSYRNLLVISESNTLKRTQICNVKTTPPHDITGKPIRNYLPKGKGNELLLQLMNESEVILKGMKTKATMIWPWGQGKAPLMPSFTRKFKKKAAVITAVHLLKGLGKILGMEVIEVPGATGYLDTNYKGKAEYALRALKHNDIVFVHVEAPDEAGHEGKVRKKIKAIEDFDKYIVGTVLRNALNVKRNTSNETRIIVLPDHPTPIKIMTHTAESVPFVIYPFTTPGRKLQFKGFNEREIKKSSLRIKEGHHLLSFLFRSLG